MKAHKAIFVGYPPGVKGYKLYDLEKKRFIVSRDVQFFEENFDHFDDQSKDEAQTDLSSIFPDVNQETESVPDNSSHEEPAIPEDAMPPVQKNENPAIPVAPVQKNENPAIPEDAMPPL